MQNTELEKRFSHSKFPGYHFTALDVYEKVLRGDLKSFPHNFFKKTTNEEDAAIIRYFLEKVIWWDEVANEPRLNKSLFKEYRLLPLFEKHHSSIVQILTVAYPKRMKL